VAAAQAGIDNEVGAAALFPVGHLALQDRAQLVRGHARPGHDARPLDHGRGGHDDDGVAAALGTGFEQQRDVEHDHRRAPGGGAGEETGLRLAHQRVQDRFQSLQHAGIVESDPAERPAVHRPVAHGVGIMPGDGRHGGPAPAHQAVNDRIGIVDGHTQPAQHLRRGGFAHADRSGQTQDEHAPTGSPARSGAARG
jgi:hypothetical protein